VKARESKLDQYAASLADLEAEKKTLKEMQAWLAEEGCVISTSTLSDYLAGQRQARLQDKLLARIANGAQQVKSVEKQFGDNPAPGLEMLIKLHRVLTLQLATQGNADPEMLKLADQLLRTAMEFASGQTKAAHKERELKLAEEKFQNEFCERILDQALRDAAERIANSNLSNADKIAAMRKEAFKGVDALEASGKVVIPT